MNNEIKDEMITVLLKDNLDLRKRVNECEEMIRSGSITICDLYNKIRKLEYLLSMYKKE